MKLRRRNKEQWSRIISGSLAMSIAAILTVACGGSDESGRASAAAIEDRAALEAAVQVAAPGRDAARAVAAARAVQALGVNSDRQVIVFGDSLSDVGTYRVGLVAQVGGGKFTTNPGPVWPETVGLVLGARVTPFRQGFFGTSQVLGGTGYAMGGARVSQQPGIGCEPDEGGACTAALTIPVTKQIDDYLTANGGRFTRKQLVLILAGANDIFYQLGAFESKVLAGVPAAQAQDEALLALQQAALELGAQVKRIVDKGATRVAVLNVPQIADTPFGKSRAIAPVRLLLAAMVTLFNDTLAAQVEGTAAALLDLQSEVARVLANPGAFLVREINVPACDLAKIAALTNGFEQGGSSLFCSRSTFVQDGAAATYMFADGVHPTTLGHLIFARFILIQLWQRHLLS